VVGRQHGHQGLDDGGRSVELPALLALGAGELAEEVFIDLAEHVPGLAGIIGIGIAETDGGHQIDQLPQLAVGQLGTGVPLVQDALELGVLRLDGGQGIVNAFADVGLLGGGADGFPTGGFGHPEDVHFLVVVTVFQLFGEQLVVAVVEEIGVGRVGKAAGQLGPAGGEGIGYVLEENQAEDQVLVFGGVHVGAQLVGGGPEGFLDVVEHGAFSLSEAQEAGL